MDPTLPAWKAENASAFACGCFKPKLMSTPPKTKTGYEGLVPCDTTGAPGYYGEKYGNNDVDMDTAAFAVMDPNTSYWQEKLGQVAEDIVKALGCDGVYMDQISASHAESCFEGGKGGGGSGWSTGNRGVLKAAAAAGKKAHGGTAIALSSESMK